MIYYSPDYKSEPDLPDDFGLMEVACSDGQHRFLPDALRCGCLKTINPQSERKRLEREVIEKVKEWYKADEPTSLRRHLRIAIRALIDFESQIKKQ